MKFNAKCAAVSLCVAVGGLGAAAPANADVWWNLKAEERNAPGSQQMCMGIAGGDPGGHVKVGTSIIVWDCNYSDDQVWNEIPLGPAGPPVQAGGIATELQDVATDGAGNSVCLFDKGGINDKGTQLTIADCNAGPGEKFVPIFQYIYDSQGFPCYRFQSAVSGRFVGVANAEVNPVKDGMSLVMWDITSSDDQVWCDHPDPTININ